MMELSQPGPRRVYCVQDTYPKWSNTTHLKLGPAHCAGPVFCAIDFCSHARSRAKATVRFLYRGNAPIPQY